MTVTPDSPSELNRRTVLRRAAAAGLLAAPAISALAACASEDGDGGTTGEKTEANPFGVGDKQPLEVAFFNGGFGEDYAKFDVAAYEAKWPGSKVDLKFSKLILTDYQPRFYGGNPPDLLNNSSPETIPVGPVIQGNQLRDLTELLEAGSYDDPKVKVKDTLVAGTIESGLFNGKPYTLNYAYSIYGMWYDETLFATKGYTVPKNWDEFAALAEKAKADKIAAFTFQGIHPWYIFNVVNEFIWMAGGLDAFMKIDNLEPNAWKQDAVKLTAERLAEMAAKGWVQAGASGLDHTTTQQAVLDGKALFIWCGSWLEGEMAKTIPAGVKLAVAPPWNISASDKSKYGTVHAAPGEGFIVPSRSKNPAGGLEFLRMMLGKEQARKFAELTKSLPVVKGAADGLTISNALTSASKVAAAAPEVISWRYEGWYAPLVTAVGNAATDLLAGKSTPDAFMAAVQKVADEVAKDEKIVKQKRTA
ncbi:N-acetylglucosamine/diacetylchitobiose ABC transporter substrate-binding protein [Catellatospora coxensis]|uniref:Carbohydrate ABC transporter, N-acetylglucosamine/diacetylchitobiose-binding protein n=1 Tax=Catellatospora coxensis TaxID=310354 RepID=A0A8J3L250_9ACTN|nr:N-acetylglucosamine/diacetylchitobiose ABC transporter substrate-binding protein [Catellatospora coxensis]GIG05265.1 carbohydrate ABC transporter, N-acetylglucosamine/diacetylchitobiose-binding protein [Catellatospora coxensis]